MRERDIGRERERERGKKGEEKDIRAWNRSFFADEEALTVILSRHAQLCRHLEDEEQ